MTVRGKSSRDVVYYFTIRKPGSQEARKSGRLGNERRKYPEGRS
jgi:hypothetical protein